LVVREPGPQLDRAALRRLAGAVRALQEGGCGIPAARLVELARSVGPQAAVTIDFEAAKELGQPLVVLRYGPPTVSTGHLTDLSPRERQIAALITEGLSNKQIARRLAIALATVKDHVHRILTKTGLPNRAAVAAAYLGHAGCRPAPGRPGL
jgi:DNA-binding NarL/FixJ family response regulator